MKQMLCDGILDILYKDQVCHLISANGNIRIHLKTDPGVICLNTGFVAYRFVLIRNITTPHTCEYPKPGLKFPRSNNVVSFLFSEFS